MPEPEQPHTVPTAHTAHTAHTAGSDWSSDLPEPSGGRALGACAKRWAKRVFEPAPPPDLGDAPAPLVQRLAWFVSLAMGSAGVVIIAAYILRGLLFLE